MIAKPYADIKSSQVDVFAVGCTKLKCKGYVKQQFAYKKLIDGGTCWQRNANFR